MKEVIFKEAYTTKEAEPQEFEKGKTYKMEDASAEHHITRGRAELKKPGGTKDK